MRHFLTITNIYKDKDLALTSQIASYITERGGSCITYKSKGENITDAAPEPSAIPPDTECVIVLGGDGTLIRAASVLSFRKIPLIGVNLGRLGFLCELEANTVFEGIDELMNDNYIIEDRMMLGGKCPKYASKDRPALNDIVIHRTGALTVINLTVYVNGEFLKRFQADGIIISTPTGSTGYNMSAGGPIVDPKASLILITPINAHDLTSRSIVIGADDEVVVEIGEKRSVKDEIIEVSFDGDNALRLEAGDKLIINKSQGTAKILRLNRKSFLENLAKKLQA
jgi:NAD+ kinase